MAIVRFPVTNGVDPEVFGGGVVSKGSQNENVLYSKYSNDVWYATQRPAIALRQRAIAGAAPPKGRGIAYWDKAASVYWVVDGVVYRNDYDTPLVDGIGGGRDPVHFFELGDYLVLIDPSTNNGYYIVSSAPNTLVTITDPDFPGALAGKSLAGGGAVMDGFLFLMTTDGHVYNCEINNPSAWNALDFIGTERESDEGIYLTKQQDNLVALCSKSIEFFYNAGNPVASPLQRRPDIFYRSGAVDKKAVFNTGERIFFVGSELTGTTGFYELTAFQLTKRSGDSIDYFISNALSRSSFQFRIAGGYVGNHYLAYLTSIAPTTSEVWGDWWEPQQTVVFDGTYNIWTSIFSTGIDSIDAFGVMQVTERGGPPNTEGRLLFMSGDIGVYTVYEQSSDFLGGDSYIEDGYIENQSDYFLDFGQDQSFNIDMRMVLTEVDFDMLPNKFCHRMSVIGTTISTGQQNTPVQISWSDDHYRNFTTPRELDTGLRRSLTRLGKFKRRAHKLEYSGSDILRIEYLEFDVRASKYA